MPPDEVRFIASPTHTVAPPAVAVGKALTVTVVLATVVQLLAFVTVAVYTPALVLVALLIFNGLADDVPPPLGNVQLYALPPEAVKVVLLPAQRVVVPFMAAVGKALILTVVVVVAALHSSAAPSGSLVVMVMVTLPAAISAAEGVYVTLVPVVALKLPLPELVQVAIVAPPPSVTLRLAVVPAQTSTLDNPDTVAGLGQAQGATVTVVLAVAVQPLASVTVTT